MDITENALLWAILLGVLIVSLFLYSHYTQRRDGNTVQAVRVRAIAVLTDRLVVYLRRTGKTDNAYSWVKARWQRCVGLHSPMYHMLGEQDFRTVVVRALGQVEPR